VSIYVRDLSSLETTLVSRAPGGEPNVPLGRYRAVLRAVDAAGNRSAATRLSFRIVRR
jgi:hypothetical protein